jgi:single-strand DNA-binding protein
MTIPTSCMLRVISEPEVTHFESGAFVVKFYGGSNEGKDKNDQWIRNGIDVEAWNKTGQVIVDYVPVGSSVIIHGQILKQEWADKTTGEKRSKHVLRANRLELLPRQGGGSQSPFGDTEPDPIGDDEIPF